MTGLERQQLIQSLTEMRDAFEAAPPKDSNDCADRPSFDGLTFRQLAELHDKDTQSGASRERSDQPHAGHRVVLDAPSASACIPVAGPRLTSPDTRSACRVVPLYSESVTPGVGCSPAGGLATVRQWIK